MKPTSPQPVERVPPRPTLSRPRAEPISPGVSEFGERMALLLDEFPTASGAVLSDATGEPIDSARRAARIEEIDIQIAGAQIGQTMARLYGNAIIFGLGTPTVIAEADGGMILARPIMREYLFTLVIDGTTSLSRALIAFEAAAEDLRAMMD